MKPGDRLGSGNTKHGLHTMKRTLQELGGRAIDGRTGLGRALTHWKTDLIRDLGGAESVSTQQLAIIDLAVKSKLLLDSIDAWLLMQPSLVDKRRRALLPVVRDRQQLADGLARYLQALGLERRKEAPIDLENYLEQHYGSRRRLRQVSKPKGSIRHQGAALPRAPAATTEPSGDCPHDDKEGSA